MKLLKIVGWILVTLIGLFVLFLLFFTLVDYKPPENEIIYASSTPDTIDPEKNLSLFLWNIGYCGLGKDMDFFYDGGSQVRTSFDNTINNFTSIKQVLKNHDTIPLILLQEVDVRSKRSYNINEADSFDQLLKHHSVFFAANYLVKFVPVPPNSPMGHVKSGLLTLSRFNPSLSVRYNFPGDYSWPTNLFMLDRCFLINRYPLKNGKELLIINSHNSAFDNGSLKEQEMNYLREFLMKEFELGNYIVVGADWNQNPPGFSPHSFSEEHTYERFQLNSIKESYLPDGWKWIFHSPLPSNRNLKQPYDPSISTLTILDFYLLSPNLNALKIKTLNLSFEHSDHHPVLLELEFLTGEVPDGELQEPVI